jgi:hypothetical protein
MTDPAMIDPAHLDAAGASLGEFRFAAARCGGAVVTTVEIG